MSDVGLLAVVGDRGHLGLQPGLLLFLLGEVVGGVGGPRVLGGVV